MPYKTLEERREHYRKNKDKINAKRREYNKRPEVNKKKKEQEKFWRDENRDKLRKRNRVYGKSRRQRNKELVLEHYGRKCVCCGESIPEFLSIDHINGGGTKHRKKIANHINAWLVSNNFPEGYQVLCFNCNWGKYYNNGICPHKDYNIS